MVRDGAREVCRSVKEGLQRTDAGGLVLLTFVAAAIGACGVSEARTDDLRAAGVAQVPCGREAAATLATTVGRVAMRIYAREVSSAAVRADQRQVEGDGRLLSALASGDRAATRRAVRSLVYSHTHIVRLRVMRRGAVVADVGGPYVLAPVGGNLRWRGRTVGRYLLSVQDDLGYVKMETRFIGEPVILHVGSRRVPLEGTPAPGPAEIPDLGPVSYRNTSYEAFSFHAHAFPDGTLRITLLVPAAAAPSGAACEAVRLAALGMIARRAWHRFALASAPPSAYVNSIASLTGSLSYVRVGSEQIAGSTRSGPPGLPDGGNVEYRDASWQVVSFPALAAAHTARVYLLAR